jgi:3-mercaptopyruvate sulfurtransferase SseA
MGCIRVRPLTGGIFAWKEAGLDVEVMSESEVVAGVAVPSR